MKNKKNVPELRFSEFNSDWIEKRLEELFQEFQSGNNITSTDIYENGSYPVFGGNGLRGYTENYTHDGFYFLIGRQGALCGNIKRIKDKVYVSEHAIACKANHLSDTEWLAQRLDYYNLNKLSESSAQPGLSVKKLLRFKLFVPTKKEQEKIASFLSAVDNKLTQLRRKKELLETYKRGLMQKLFSQQIRFKQDDGTAFPDWQEKSLGELGEFKNGFNADKQSFGSGIEFINLMDIFGKNEITKTLLERVQIPQKQLEQYKIKKGDVLFVRSSVKRSGVGQSCLVNDDFEDTVYSGFIIRFREKYNDLIHFYKKYCFSSLEFRENILSVATSSANTNINQESLVNILLCYPCKEEQQKIADCLTALDKKIEAVAQQIHHTEQFKKGLLQKMFV